ncbi:MAG: UDP-N-acetylmuramoyl-tripeptide--D-alanyl-D-alanine ligase [Actinomycetota bacterium]|nr:UDP-N-acetylmuramoyl-tripeptide--D-alanyl-D-alanine ligase [Actinomycetota bacterium]
MIPLSVEEVGRLCPGRLDAEPWADVVSGVQIDSRRIREGDLFVAVGRGADFRRHAFARGAAATLVPDDAFAALAALGRTVRERSAAQVVGITGSTGKTSTKDILAALCRPHAHTVAAEASYNNELGVPLTLCRLEPDTEICIVELAMRGHGQIAALCAIARPTLGVITNIAPVHLERVGSLAGVARAKSELIAALPAGSTAVIPAHGPELEPHLREDLHLVRLGRDARLERFDPPTLAARVAGEDVELQVPFTARHQAENAVAALAAYAALALPLAEAGRGASEIEFSRWRGEERPLAGGGVLIADCWNANPVSMDAALEHLVARAAARRSVAVLGDMAELGPESPRFHRAVGESAAQLGIDVLIAIGPLARLYAEAAEGVGLVRWAETVPEGIEELREVLREGDCVLVKGSRAMGLEAVADALTAAETRPRAAARG